MAPYWTLCIEGLRRDFDMVRRFISTACLGKRACVDTPVPQKAQFILNVLSNQLDKQLVLPYAMAIAEHVDWTAT